MYDRAEREITRMDVADRTAWDRAIVAVEGASPLLTPIAGAVVNVLTARASARRVQRRVDLLLQLDRAVRRLETRVDLALADTETFADIVEAVADRIDSRESEGKARYFAAAIAHSLTPSAPSAVNQAQNIAVLDALRPAHLEIIAMLMTTRIRPAETGDRSAMIPILQRRLPSMTVSQLETHWHDLQTQGIVHWLAQPNVPTPRDPLLLISELTPFGRRFARWVLLEETEP